MEPLPAVVEKRKSEAERESREEGEATHMGQVRFSISVLVSSFTIKKRRLKWARSDHQACALSNLHYKSIHLSSIPKWYHSKRSRPCVTLLTIHPYPRSEPQQHLHGSSNQRKEDMGQLDQLDVPACHLRDKLFYFNFAWSLYKIIQNYQLPEECVREILSRLSDSSDLDRAGEYDATTLRWFLILSSASFKPWSLRVVKVI